MADGGTASRPESPPLRADTALSPELMLWLSPAFPVGGFAYSHGLERLVEAGSVKGPDELGCWIADLATIGSLRNDAILLAAAWRAASRSDWPALIAVANLGAALQPSAERQRESLNQGAAFAATIARSWPGPATTHVLTNAASRLAYPVAVAAAASDHGISLQATSEAYAISFASALVSAAIRLSVIGQFDGQAVLADLLPNLTALARFATTATLGDLGGATFLSDIASMEHETQYTRLFRS